MNCNCPNVLRGQGRRWPLDKKWCDGVWHVAMETLQPSRSSVTPAFCNVGRLQFPPGRHLGQIRLDSALGFVWRVLCGDGSLTRPSSWS